MIKKYIGEYWADIKDFVGLYQVSNFGKVRSLDRYVIYKNGNIEFKKGRVLKPFHDSRGYEVVKLQKEGNIQSLHVHRLVAQAFIPNPKHLPCVNHKDENKTNNRMSNLEWCTYKYNINYGTVIERQVSKRINGVRSTPVLQLTIDGVIVNEWVSMSEIERQLGHLGYSTSAICACCKGKRNSHKGYKWEYKQQG